VNAKRGGKAPASNVAVGHGGARERAVASDTPAPVEAQTAKKKPVKNFKRHTSKVISEEFSDIVETMANKSKAGSLAHTKYLFEIGGVKEEIQRQGQGKGEPSLADLLLAEVRRQRSADAARASEKAADDDMDDSATDCGAKAQ